MNDLVSKLSSYEIFTNLIPGSALVFWFSVVGPITIPTDILSQFLIFYLVGMSVSRLSSLILEPILKALKFVKYAEYRDYVSACFEDSKIATLVEVSNMYRSVAMACALAILVLLLAPESAISNAYDFKYTWIFYTFLAFCLFCFAFRKQSNFVNKRVQRVTEGKTCLS